MARTPDDLLKIARLVYAESAKRRAMQAEAMAALGHNLTWDEVVAWHERKPAERVIHMGRLDENAKMPPPGTVITGIQIRKPDGTVVLDERFDPPVITK
jgi:hypothetical protein